MLQGRAGLFKLLLRVAVPHPPKVSTPCYFKIAFIFPPSFLEPQPQAIGTPVLRGSAHRHPYSGAKGPPSSNFSSSTVARMPVHVWQAQVLGGLALTAGCLLNPALWSQTLPPWPQVTTKFPLMLFMLSDLPAPTFSACEPSQLSSRVCRQQL